jgi:2-phospho-L-lactate/phosphoenolpyruvate guanylyltransferase
VVLATLPGATLPRARTAIRLITHPAEHSMVAGVTEMPLTWSVVIPVKVLARAKSRLAGLAGPARAELALAMAADTVRAAAACPAVAAVFVVTDDPAAASALSALGARVVADEPDDGLNPALAHGAAAAAASRPDCGTAALAADLPALRPAELERGLRAAAQWPEAFVPDAEGTGTTLYAARPGVAFRPRFGAGSAARYREGGAAEIGLTDVPSLRSDVDTPAGLEAALSLGVGPRTAELAAQIR